MDPIEALRQLRLLANDESTYEPGGWQDLFDGLDQWMSRGGFSPWTVQARETQAGGYIKEGA